MRTDRRAWGRVALGAALALLTGCAGKLADKQAFIEAYEADAGNRDYVKGCGDVVTRIFIPSCGGNGCHGGTAPQQDLDLVSPGVASRVSGVAGKGCAVTLADPSNPEASLMYLKLAPKPPCGAPMPLARPPLNDADTACVLAWIGAQ